MNGEQLYAALGYADDALLKRYFEGTKRIKKRNIRVKWGAIAACFCVVAAVFAFGAPFGLRGRVANRGIETGGTSESAAGSQVLYKPGGTVVAEYPPSSSFSYVSPKNGQWFCFLEVKDALKAYAGKDVTYFLAFDIFSDSQALDVKSKEMTNELKRLSGLGYHVGYAEAWTYGGEKGERVPYTIAAGFFTEKELKTFRANKKYGYAFRFQTNGDGSPVSCEKGIVCNFEGNRK